MRHMLARVGWKPDFIEKSVPILPISGWMGDNLIKKSEKMGWWKGMDVKTLDNRTVHVDTLLDVSCTGREGEKGGSAVWCGVCAVPGLGHCAYLTAVPPLEVQESRGGVQRAGKRLLQSVLTSVLQVKGSQIANVGTCC